MGCGLEDQRGDCVECLRAGTRLRQYPPRKCSPQQPGIRNSSRCSWPQSKARRTDITSPHRCGLTRTPRLSSARHKASERAAHSSTSACNSATLRANASVGSGPRTTSFRSTSFPRRRVTTSRRAAVSSTGEMRFCEIGMAIVTRNHSAQNMPAGKIAVTSRRTLQDRGISPRCGRGSLVFCHAPRHAQPPRAESPKENSPGQSEPASDALG